MQKDNKTPLWVYLALSSIETRKGAKLLILSNIVFSAYCVPWVSFFNDIEWVAKLFLLEDWEWFAMTSPMTIWYWLSLKWVDKNRGWQASVEKV
ncbi:hypothetical protein KEF85_11500 [Methylomonas paludis]|uniref:Uncharacterized protein n=1 Tax=Methylomonas paludis TaxID=1173101 RepID=A0A975MLC9_9GAMM|nr:hypothetical protein [Methylomonas paludis]QWF69976.1 hypothetical protein KEF85_11500 [Methylomonas paludis]